MLGWKGAGGQRLQAGPAQHNSCKKISAGRTTNRRAEQQTEQAEQQTEQYSIEQMGSLRDMSYLIKSF